MSISAFFCETPYHILNAINIKWHLLPQEQADIFVRNVFLEADKLVQRLEKSGLFRHVFLIDLPFDRTFSRFQGRYLKICAWNLIKRYIPSDLADALYYHKIWAFNECIMSWNFFEFFNRKNKDIELFFVDEGILSYYANAADGSPRRRWLWEHVHIRFFSTDRVKSIFLYAPELASFSATTPILPLPKLNRDETDFVAALNKIFDFNKEEAAPFEGKTYIYLDQPVLETNDIQTDNGLAFLEELSRHVNKSEILIKLHPRRECSFYDAYGYHTVSQSRYSFELLLLNHSMEQKILISEMSTALLTSKMIFDEEPRVLLTYRMEARSQRAIRENLMFRAHQQQQQQLFHSVQQSYTCKDRFCIPSNWDEILQFLHGKGAEGR